jgi:hypothetical protein
MQRIVRSDTPPIDAGDEEPGEAPDRSLVWSSYLRSHVSLSGSPWIEDDEYVAYATRCLGQGLEQLLYSLQDRAMGFAGRDRILLKSLVSGLIATGFDRNESAAYLRYHRDWLLRFFLDEESKESRMLEYFDNQSDGMSHAVHQIRAVWDAQGDKRDGWQKAIASLVEYTKSFQGDSKYIVTPYTSNVTFSPVFKVFHGLANQIGVPPLREAFVHHLIIAALAPNSIGVG